MRLEEAQERLTQFVRKPFGDLFSPSDMEMIRINKGKTGQLLELALGMQLSSTNLDFEDGELKTNKCDSAGNPKETIFITQISSMMDELLQGCPFECTRLYKKISNILYVPVCKDGEPQNWMFLESKHIDLSNPQFSWLKEIWRNDYNSICYQLRSHIENPYGDGFIHTCNGIHMQVRSKDAKDRSGRYHPIFSNNRKISNKNYAFYFTKQFVYDVKNII